MIKSGLLNGAPLVTNSLSLSAGFEHLGRKRGSSAYGISLSPARCPNMTEILLKRT